MTNAMSTMTMKLIKSLLVWIFMILQFLYDKFQDKFETSKFSIENEIILSLPKLPGHNYNLFHEFTLFGTKHGLNNLFETLICNTVFLQNPWTLTPHILCSFTFPYYMFYCFLAWKQMGHMRLSIILLLWRLTLVGSASWQSF